MEPLSKRARVDAASSELQRLLHCGRITNDGLLALLRSLRSGNLNLDDVNRGVLRSSYLARAMSMGCTLRMPLDGGGEFEWFFLDPNALLTQKVAESPALQRIFGEAVRRNPPSPSNPWRLVVGYDEYTPGNKFRIDNNRKAFVLSFTFLELEVLDSEMVWFTPVCVRTCGSDNFNDRKLGGLPHQGGRPHNSVNSNILIRVESCETKYTEDSSSWQGRWWLVFLLAGILASSIVQSGWPRHCGGCHFIGGRAVPIDLRRPPSTSH